MLQNLLLGEAFMMCVGAAFIYLAVQKRYEPLLLLPIGFGALMANIPNAGLMEEGGILRIIYDVGVISDLFPCLIFLGIGAMCDFGAIIENPWLLFFAASGQLGIFIAINFAQLAGFSPMEAASIGMIGAMDGPTAIYVATKFADHLVGPIAVCAYSYMSLIPIIQAPLCKALTTREERLIRMSSGDRSQSKTVRVLFPLIVFLLVSLIVPSATPLIGCLMLGNLMKESGVVERLRDSVEGELTNAVTLLLGLSIGGAMESQQFLTPETVLVFALGLISFISALACGVLFAKAVSRLTGGRVNPLIGSCGVSAFPMAARTVHRLGREEDPDNWLLPHAMAANTGGQIASVVAGGAVLKLTSMILG